MSLKFTIVTPSFNQAPFLPKTLDSIERQSYRDYEHLIFDPGSHDGSLMIAEAYCARNPLATLFMGLDNSQTHAINLGFGSAQGDILCWLNSDDRYATPDVLDSVARAFEDSPEVDILYGRGIFVSPDGAEIKEAFVHRNAADLRKSFSHSLGILQPSLFMRRSAFETAGRFDQRMNYSFDYEYWARCAAFGLKFRFIDQVISHAIIHDDAKTIRARGVSLAESLTVGKRYYDFLSVDWIRRAVDQEQSGADGITASSEAVPEEMIAERFRHENANGRALTRYVNNDPAMNEITRKGFADWVIPTIRQAYLSGWDRNYFDMGMTLIASIHKYDPEKFIFIYDLGMLPAQLALVGQMRNVILLSHDFPNYSADWQRNPKNYVFKNVLFNDVMKKLAPGAILLWIDAGVCLCQVPSDIFQSIETDGYFFIDHDDSDFWPFFNASFTSDAAIQVGRFSYAEMSGPHVCSCLFGARVDGPGTGMLAEAARLAHIYDIAVGDKHPPDDQKLSALPRPQQTEHSNQLRNNTNPVDGLPELRRIYGYYGHRQDQSILSLLVARHQMRISSAKTFCPATPKSSQVSKENWFDGVSRNLGAFSPNQDHPGGITFHHRGLIKDFEGVEFAFPRKKRLIIHGGMTCLDYEHMPRRPEADFFCFGRSYLEWGNQTWHPTLYAELGAAAGWACRQDILGLVNHSCWNGIRLFVLRRNLVEWLVTQKADLSRVVDFDQIASGFDLLRSQPVSNGSHALMLAAMLGYEEIVLTGFGKRAPQKPVGTTEEAGNLRIESWDALNRDLLSRTRVSLSDGGWLDRYFSTVPARDIRL